MSLPKKAKVVGQKPMSLKLEALVRAQREQEALKLALQQLEKSPLCVFARAVAGT